MRRSASALTLMFGLLLSFMAGTQILDTTRANFIPTVSIEVGSPTNGTTYESIPLLNVTVSFYAWGNRSKFVVYSVDDSANNTLTGNFSNIEELSWFSGSTALPKLAGGEHSIRVYAWVDVAANSGYIDKSSSEVVFYVNKQETSEPTIVPPAILICSPQNNSVTSSDSISLIFSVSAPEAVKAIDSYLRYIYYKADWQTKEQYLYVQNLTNDEHFDFMEFNTTLSNVPNGTRTLQIVACGTVIITEAMFGFDYGSETNASVVFTVNSMQSTPSPEPTHHPEAFPTTLVIASIASVAVIGGSLLVYFRKYRH